MVGSPVLGPAALDVEDHERQLGRHGEPDGLALERDARAARRRDAEGPAEGGADGRRRRGDLVLGLERPHPEALVQRQLLEDAARRRDRVGAEDDGDLRALRGGEEAPGQRAIARHAPVGARRHLRGLDAVVLGEHLRRLAEGMAGLEHADVRLDVGLVLGEALLDGVEGRIERTRVDPRDEAEREEVLAALLLLRVQGKVLEPLHRHAADVDLVEAVLLPQRGVLERILGVAGLVQVALVEGRRVDDEDPARLEVGEVHLERRGVHGHQRVELVARRIDPLAAELKLEARDAEQRAGGRADLGGEIRQRRDVVPGPRRLGGELLARDLHAVAGVAGEPDHGPGERAPRLLDNSGRRHRIAHCCPSFLR